LFFPASVYKTKITQELSAMAAVIFGLLGIIQDFYFLMWMNRVGLCDHIAL